MAQMTKLGALWISKTGKALSGTIEIDGVKTPIVIFDNGYKKEEKHPDKIIYLSEKQTDNTYNRTAEKTSTSADNPFSDESIPF